MPADTARLGELIHQQTDPYGQVTVYQNKQLRYLTFGNAVEQSCLDIERPYLLKHVYTQAMMLGLVFQPEAQSALVLGVGGGSLIHALHKARPNLQISGVEYRPAVIEVAHSHFKLPVTPKVKIHCQTAQQHLDSNIEQHELIFADLYVDTGAHESQTKAAFLQQAQQHLSRDGILLINHWASEYQQTQQTREVLQEIFQGEVLSLPVQGGNSIVFCFNGGLPTLNRNEIFDAAQQLSQTIATPLQNLARSFWRHNAQPLKIRRQQQ